MPATEAIGLTEDDRTELRSTVRGFLQDHGSTTRLREIVAQGGDAWLPLWREIAELGWLGIEVPETHDGVGGRFADLAVVLEELGRLMTPVPFMSAAALGVGSFLHARASLRDEWLPRLAAGAATVTAALTSATGDLGFPDIVATGVKGAWSLSGVSGFVPDARSADATAVAARHPGAGTVSVFLVGAGTPGLTIMPLETVDVTRRLDRVVLNDVHVSRDAALAPIQEGGPLRAELLDRAALAIACDAAGGARRALDITLEHLKTREQFGRPIGSFQSIKHRCADLHLRAGSARTAAVHAAATAEDPFQRTAAASIAKSVAGEAYAAIAAEAVQLHGGVGYTEEYDPHLHLKRARLSVALFGDTGWHRDRLARLALEGAWT
jgi:alkylation response protein AidB-like acyl-CoA dehydrogenase